MPIILTVQLLIIQFAPATILASVVLVTERCILTHKNSSGHCRMYRITLEKCGLMFRCLY